MLYISAKDACSYFAITTTTGQQHRLLRMHTMAALNLGPLHRDKANYIFNNNRLLAGRLERDNQKTEAWFGKTLPSVVAGAGFGWRLYITANGSEQLMVPMS